MEALTELCDLIADNPTLFADKISWICSRCPPPSSPRLTRARLHALLTLARFLSKCSHSSTVPILEFFRSIPSPAFRPTSFFADLLRYLSSACVISPELSPSLSPLLGAALIATEYDDH